MSETIIDLWNDKLDPIRDLGQNNAEIEQLEALMQRNLEKLQTTADKTSANILDAYTDCVDECVTSIAEQAFCGGFSLKVKLDCRGVDKKSVKKPPFAQERLIGSY